MGAKAFLLIGGLALPVAIAIGALFWLASVWERETTDGVLGRSGLVVLLGVVVLVALMMVFGKIIDSEYQNCVALAETQTAKNNCDPGPALFGFIPFVLAGLLPIAVGIFSFLAAIGAHFLGFLKNAEGTDT